MKHSITFLFLAVASLVLWRCDSQVEGTLIEGDISNADNLQVYIDRVIIGKANSVLAKADIDGSGHFELAFPEGLDAGIYNLRIGAKRINFVLSGEENVVSITGDLTNLQGYDLTIDGSPDSETFAAFMRSLIAREVQLDDLRTFIDTVQNPQMAAFVAYRSLGANGELIDLHKKAQNKLASAQPDSEMASEYGKFISQLEAQYRAQLATQRIRVGQPAPDIRLPSPNGKEFSLSDLKGKVVLLDFWASWCGPCRRENPNVVRVYEKYKEQGFTVFSVSLDGLDDRTRSRISNEEKLGEMVNRYKSRWVQAIQQDGLSWPYHVSDLKKWDSAPAATYGVRGIPRTFLIDREGKIAAVNLRGAAQIEQALLNHL